MAERPSEMSSIVNEVASIPGADHVEPDTINSLYFFGC